MKKFEESWALHKALTTAAMDEEEIVDVPIPASEEKESVKAGQIRLMAGMLGWNWVLVLKEWEPGQSWVVMPYSWLNVPGRDEFVSSYAEDWGREVLQVWNTMTLATATLESCPVWDNAPETAVEEAWKAWECYLQCDMNGWTGPTMGSSDDASTEDYRNSVLSSWSEVSNKDLQIQLGEAE